MDSKVLQIIHVNGCSIKTESELLALNPTMWIQASIRNAYGLFSHDVCSKSIFLFDLVCPQQDIDYVLAHEFGHYMSCVMSYGVHSLVKNSDRKAIQENLFLLVLEEEYRADTFAIALSTKLNFSVSEWVYSNRMTHYDKHISPERRRELSEEVNLMLAEAFHGMEQAA